LQHVEPLEIFEVMGPRRLLLHVDEMRNRCNANLHSANRDDHAVELRCKD